MKKISWKYRTITILLGLGLAMTTTPTFASHPEVSLTGSNFEIDTDANIKVDDPAPSSDWANVTETRKADAPSGNGDNSFGQGSKEDTAVPSVVSGSIPPNKSDLKAFGVYAEKTATKSFIHLFWSRVQDPSGTTNMDFELNKLSTLSSNGVTPVRSVGDLLITYDLSQGGTNPVLSLRTWNGSAWGAATNLTTSGKATGSINSSTILAADSDGLGQQDPRTFGEASIDFDAIIPPGSTCTSFGSAYLKSRSSDSFSAATKDFIAPVSVSISNCATVIIKKETIPDKATGDFGFTHTLALIPASNSPFSLQDGGSTTFNNVVPTSGSTTYTVSEDDPTSDGFALTAIDCTSSDIARTFNKDVAARSASFGIAVGETITCTFTNTQQGKIIVKKVCNDADTTQNFQFTSSFSGGPGTLKCGEEKTSNSLAPGTYSVSEDVPAGWILVSSTCDDESAPSAINLGAGETVTCTFTNAKQRGAIKVTKTRKHAADGPGDHPHAGVDFTVNGVTKTTNANGVACFDGLLLGSYTVHETVPAGYVGENDKTVTVNNVATCQDNPYGGETVSFHNMPLTNITVSVDSQVNGGTASTIQCVPGPATPTSTNANGDGSLPLNNLQPGTYTCTIVVDP